MKILKTGAAFYCFHFKERERKPETRIGSFAHNEDELLALKLLKNY